MELKEINQTLAQLEKNLQNLDSARVQVEKVTGSNKELAQALEMLSKDVASLADKISNETSSAITLYRKTLQTQGDTVMSKTEEWKKNIDSSVYDFKREAEKLRTISENSIRQITDQSKNAINDIKEKVKSLIDSNDAVIKQLENLSKIFASKTDIADCRNAVVIELTNAKKDISKDIVKGNDDLKKLFESQNAEIAKLRKNQKILMLTLAILIVLVVVLKFV